ncbi:MAG: metallophosphoesterase, partial [Candidatus Micrarchaeia archaeon]
AFRSRGKADAIIVAGDVFDTKIPKLETLKRAADMFSGRKKPIFIIHGNHERRSRDMTNPVQLLSKLAGVKYVHAGTEIIEAGGERVSITCMGSVPEDVAREALKKVLALPVPGADFRILMIHQSIKELVYGGEDELSLDDLRDLEFDLIVDGHIHKYHSELDGKLLIPGSTVITQLRNDEQGERGYILYDTGKKEHTFQPIASRLFFYSEVALENAALEDAKNSVLERIQGLREDHEGAIVKVRITGTLKHGLSAGDFSISCPEGVFVQNALDSESAADKIKKLREKSEDGVSVREAALKRLAQKVRGKVAFDPVEMFEKLAESADAGQECLEARKGA